MKKMINYYCPEFFRAFKLYENLLILQSKYPEIFYENINIKRVFGSFPGMIWNGGSVFMGGTSLKEVEECRNKWEYLGIPLQITITNPCLIKEDCYDRYCNKILEIMENGKNEVLISSEILEEYIRKEFPGYKINSSIIRESKINTNKIIYDETIFSKYENIVLPKRYLKDFEYLNKIDKKFRNKIEFLCTDPCPSNCPKINSHYEEMGKTTLFEIYDDFKLHCSSINHSDLFGTQQFIQDQILYEEIVKDFLPLGYTEFKISGRGESLGVLLNLLPYIIKPEYHLLVIKYLLSILL